MFKLWRIVALLAVLTSSAAAEVLIVADEFPAMEVLARRLEREDQVRSQVVPQTDLKDLARFSAVVVYIHRDLHPAAERAFIEYTQGGGRLVLLHHSISSGKRKNRDWFAFLDVALPAGDVERGGYKWIEDVTVEWVNLNERHPIMTNRIHYAQRVPFPAFPKPMPAFTLRETEVYLNHVLSGPRRVLMGLRYTDSQSGRVWTQETAGWIRAAGQGWVVYFMPGHSRQDFEDATYGRIVLNAITAPVELLAVPGP